MMHRLAQLADGETLYSDVCIIGAGAAGIALADRLSDSGLAISVFESGGLDYNVSTQDLYIGSQSGIEYNSLDASRLRYFGGTTNHWAGYCAPFVSEDFEPIQGIADSGWPIRYPDVASYIDLARAYIGLPADSWDPQYWQRQFDLIAPPGISDRFDQRTLLIHPTRFGQTRHEYLNTSESIKVFLHANLVEIETNADARPVTSDRLRTLDRKELRSHARAYVLCTGGIENARLLLASNRVMPMGLGNQHDLVGRFFTDHVNLDGGILVPTAPSTNFNLFDEIFISELDLEVELILARRSNAGDPHIDWPRLLRLFPRYADGRNGEGTAALQRMGRSIINGQIPDRLGSDIVEMIRDIGSLTKYASYRMGFSPSLEDVGITVRIAPLPNAESRVTLSNEVDAIGMRRAHLHWAISPTDKKNARQTVLDLAAIAGANGLGRVRLLIDEQDNVWNESFHVSNHHMCTTRMAANPRHGVVDANCLIHGMSNLYVGGSSVFATAGSGTPTMMIIALSMRLGDHLKAKLT